EDGDEPEDESGGKRDGEGEGEHDGVDRDVGETRQVAEFGGGEGAQGSVSEGESEGSAGEGEDEAFEQEFAGDAAPPGAQGGADGEFLAAAVGAHEEEVGDVGTGNQQDHADGAHEDPEGGGDVAEQVVL